MKEQRAQQKARKITKRYKQKNFTRSNKVRIQFTFGMTPKVLGQLIKTWLFKDVTASNCIRYKTALYHYQDKTAKMIKYTYKVNTDCADVRFCVCVICEPQ